MAKKLRSRYAGSVAMAAVVLLAACSSVAEPDTPTPVPSATPEPTKVSALAECGGPIEHSSSESLTAIYPQNDGYLWTLPDGTDANVSFDDIIASDPNANETTRLSMPIWSQPVVSPDLKRSAIVVQKRTFSSSADTRPVVIISDADDPVLGTFDPAVDGSQALVTMGWLAESGCLAVLVFTPTHEQQLHILQPNAEVVATFRPTLARGSVIDASVSGWIVLDRLTWEPGEIELFNVDSPGTTIVVSAGEPVPKFLGLPGVGLTVEEFVAAFRDQAPNR